MTILDEILVDVKREVAAARLARPVADLRSRTADARPPRPFAAAFDVFGLIAEIKECSPSVGPMRKENVEAAPGDYEECPLVRAVSVLTNETHFGMNVLRLQAVSARLSKPILRKDFMIDEYQVREARAFGADAILLMANVLDASRLSGFYNLARELGMEALFEVHTAEEIELLPADARMVGINSRKFKSTEGFAGRSGRSETDFSLDPSAFELASRLPAGTLRVAESGLSPKNISGVREAFHAALVGTSLLRDPCGPAACLRAFEDALG